MSSYDLIAIRYKKKEEDGMMRREFFPRQIEEAKAFYNELKEQNYAHVECRDLEVERGGSETMKGERKL